MIIKSDAHSRQQFKVAGVAFSLPTRARRVGMVGGAPPGPSHSSQPAMLAESCCGTACRLRFRQSITTMNFRDVNDIVGISLGKVLAISRVCMARYRLRRIWLHRVCVRKKVEPAMIYPEVRILPGPCRAVGRVHRCHHAPWPFRCWR